MEEQLFTLNNDVFIVEGKNKDCIYDLLHEKLYHINKNCSRLIHEVCNCTKKLNGEEREYINSLVDLGILVSSDEKKEMKYIDSILTETQIYFAWIEICTLCNLKCIHCYNESSPQCSKLMEYEEFCDVCNKLKRYGLDRVQIIGGEPFCHPRIKDMIEYASSMFSSVEIFTNGILLTSELCDWLVERGVKIALSVYSYIDTEHDKVTTVSGSHKKTLCAIGMLKERNIKYRIATVHMKGIYTGEKNTELFTIDEKKDVIRLSGRGDKVLLSPELLKKRMITQNSFSGPLKRTFVTRLVSGHQCFDTKIYVSVDLEVFPCAMERRISHGSIRTSELKDILDDEIRKLNKDYIEECKECEFRYACHDCRPNTVGEIYSKPYYCTYSVDDGKWMDVSQFVDAFFQEIS